MSFASDWLHKTKTERQAALQQLVQGKSSFDFINLVRSGSRGVVASLGQHFGYAVFGRDSIRVAKDLLETHKELAHIIILTLAELQGVTANDQNEEEPGKIHHEHRSLIVDGSRIPEDSAAILHTLQKEWGQEGADEMTYYGSVDTTPLYVRLVFSYVKRHGAAILDETVKGRDGQVRTIRKCVQNAATWVADKLITSEWGLLEYKRRNPTGIPNQAWKDSATSYLHLDGKLANFDDGIASIEIQGYAYDALHDACKLFSDNPELVDLWRSIFRALQQITLEKFWMPDSLFFAQGLDRDEKTGEMRQIATLTSNPGLLLRSKLFHDLRSKQRTYYVENIVRMLISPEFLTAAGIRCRALRHKHIPGFPDYHGTFVTWPKETYEFAKGLRYLGYEDLADKLNSQILKSVMGSGEFYEFFYVNDDGTIWYDREEAMKHFQPLSHGQYLPVPEAAQAWTISAVLAIIQSRSRTPSGQPTRTLV